jgi:tetratricopeptide (TPR) repeat protein
MKAMSADGNRAAGSAADVEDLLLLALSRPEDAAIGARTLLSGRPTAVDASIAEQTLGIVLRDRGETTEALRRFRRALRLARACSRLDREADVRASLGVALTLAGFPQRGLGELDAAAGLAHGALAGRVLMRRADTLAILDRYPEALHDLHRAVAVLHRAGDAVWEARSRTHRGLTYLALGQTRRADADFALAERQFALTGQEFEYAMARHNRGLVAAAAAHLPEALEYLADAGRRYALLGTPMPDLAIDRCAVLLSAGLATDALAEADGAAAELAVLGGQETKLAELLFSAATAALAAGDPQAAQRRAGRAVRLFRRQRRERWANRTQLVLLQARHADGDILPSTYRLAASIAIRLEHAHAEEAPRAHLLAGRLALGGRRAPRAEQHFAAAAGQRRAGSALARTTGWLAQALLCQVRGNQRGMLAACRRGLDVLDEHRASLGASELRAVATAHGAELATIGQRSALTRRDPGGVLRWSERWRATALAVPPTRPGDDAALTAELSALREIARKLDSDRPEGADPAALQRERLRLERAVRARVLRTRGPVKSARPGPDPIAAQSRWPIDSTSAAGVTLVELVAVDGTLHAVTVTTRGARLHEVGPLAEAVRELDFTRLLLGRLARGRGTGSGLERLADAGCALQKALLGPAAADLTGDAGGEVVVVPPGRLHALPWGLLPALSARRVAVAPSAAAWLRARAAADRTARESAREAGESAEPSSGRAVLVVGPDLITEGAEVALIAGRYPGATLLADGAATADRVLAALDGARLAHIAAHGVFRADNPLFSSLRLDDGPLTVHDLERLHLAPHRLVLSSCESGRAAPVGADELLGLATSLLPLGTVGIVAAVVPVNDAATVGVMQDLHERLADGAGMPEALLHARGRAAAGGDPVAMATACSFVALGV